jgi:hypothetical protein
MATWERESLERLNPLAWDPQRGERRPACAQLPAPVIISSITLTGALP